MGKRLIDADALMNKINNMVFTADMTTTLAVNMACRWIENAPTVEERKKGKWIRRKGMYEIGFKCSECDAFSIVETPYCSNCGADMRGKHDADIS